MNRYVRISIDLKEHRSMGYDKRELGIRYGGGRKAFQKTSYGHIKNAPTEDDMRYAPTGIPTIEDFINFPNASIKTILGCRLSEDIPENGSIKLVHVKKTSSARRKFIEGYISIVWSSNINMISMEYLASGKNGMFLVHSSSTDDSGKMTFVNSKHHPKNNEFIKNIASGMGLYHELININKREIE